jgi:predicted N-acyltransferase
VEIRFHSSINDIPAERWNSLIDNDYPFIRHEFFHALENSADNIEQEAFIACCKQSGWQANHVAVYQNNVLVACMPNYTKSHSYGEYIFDWAWANAYSQHGYDYYPKLLSAVPFSPVSGPRLISKPSTDKAQLHAAIFEEIKNHCEKYNYSSFHALYLPEHDSESFNALGMVQRHSFQYHWKNRNEHQQRYSAFDDFLETLKSRKRKSIRKERNAIAHQCIEFEQLRGEQIEHYHWDLFYRLYQITYLKRSGHAGYLPKAFFISLAESLGDQVMLILARKNGDYIAGAMYLVSETTLYGRYWGCREHAEFLHFETCIYQGIDYCIEQGIETFDAGAQGEHKLQRGFVPVSTWSNHWIRDPGFRRAITSFIAQEAEHHANVMEQARTYLPYKTE